MVIKCALIFIMGLAVTAGIFLLLKRQPIGPTYGEGFRMLARLDRDIFYKSLVIYGGTVLVTLVCIAVITMLYSHRVAGPVYRLRLFAAQIMGGDLRARVTLRQTDVVQPLAVEMNRMNEQFAQTFGAIRQEIEALEKQVDILEKGGGGSRATLREIKAGAERIAAFICKYRL
jgi:methyl-accepting chemotaxis protein